MVLLLDGTNSDVVLTLTEKVALTNPDFILILVNDNTGKKVGCKIVDVSAYPERFNQFVVKVQANPVALSGQVLLDDYGFYHYYTYEIANAATFNFATVDSLDLETMSGLLETGKVNYYVAPTSPDNYANTRSSIKSYGN